MRYDNFTNDNYILDTFDSPTVPFKTEHAVEENLHDIFKQEMSSSQSTDLSNPLAVVDLTNVNPNFCK